VPEYNEQAVLTANTGPGSISPELVSFQNGVWSGQVTFRGAGGAVSLSCSDFSSPPHTGTSASFVVTPGPFAKLQVLLPGETPQGGTTAGQTGTPTDQAAGHLFNVTVRAVDAYWNLVGGIGDSIALTSSDPFAGLPADTVLANGQVQVPCRLYLAGSQNVTASDLDQPAITPDTSSDVTVVPGPFARLLIIAPGESPAPGTETGRSGAATDQSINYAFTVTVFATDNYWNPVGGVDHVVHLSSSDALAALPNDTALIDGQVDLTVRLATGGFQQLTVADVTDPAVPGSTTQVRAISSGFHLEATVEPDSARAGEPFTLHVRVTNDAGSTIQEINSFVTIEVLNGSTREPGRGALLNTRFQLLQGERSIAETYTFAEPIVLIASDDLGNAPAASNVIVITPGVPAAITLASDPPWVRGNRHAALTARVVDAFDNGVPGEPLGFELLSGQGVLTAADSLTGDLGTGAADYLSAREPETARIRASSRALSVELALQTAFVDPTAGGGTITNYPNPFHPDLGPTTIAYKIDDNATVVLDIFTLSGERVRHESFAPGTPGGASGLNEFAWDGRNGSGDLVASGGYVVAIEARGGGETLHVMRRKIAVVR